MSRWMKTKGYDYENSANVAAGATVVLTGFSISVPHSTALKITHFANNVQPVGGWGYTTWVLKINGVPQVPLDNVTDQLGQIGLPTELGVQPIARGGELIEVWVTNTSAAATNIAVRLKGEYGRDS